MKLNRYVGYAVCENTGCNKTFPIDKNLVAHLNINGIGPVSKAFEDYSFNRIKCKYCNTAFTFEFPLIVYDMQKQYVVFAQNPFGRSDRLPRLLEITGCENLKIYRVPYYAFAVEVTRTYKYGVDYEKICEIKNKMLSADKLDIRSEYIIFYKYEDGIIFYHHLNYLNKVIHTYKINYEL